MDQEKEREGDTHTERERERERERKSVLREKKVKNKKEINDVPRVYRESKLQTDKLKDYERERE